ncbi:hypothetical protein MCUN1_000899 [Malassezia cuniculi]|uniref:Cation/H+ exchanger transmembrane domain-containing protein n=1 Tax=Malassezia cuniculi TaxID=948313 RepID=A0AAF0ET52_9BASI|nr:hypothetical protein MCUN1_000899 [Malassezia cuniculi]
MLEGQEHSFKPWETSAPHIIYVLLGFFVVFFGMFSLFIKERLYMGEAPLSLAFGIIIGPIAAIFSVGVELPRKYVMHHWRTLVFLLGPVMVWSWLISALLIWALIPGLDFLNSLVIASCLSPTDPILAQAVVGGPWAEKHVPSHIRHMLQCESGCNDGAAFPFLYIAYYLTVNRGQVGFPVAKWFYQTWAWEICLGTFIGALIGFCARKLMRISERYKLVDRESFVAQYLSLALASMGLNVLIGSDDLLAAFACGTAFAWDGWFSKETEDSNFSSIVDLVFNIATFIYIGAIMPWHTFNDSEIGCDIWRLIVLAILVLLVKRIPIVLLVWKWIPDIKTFREALFTGYFGPMGVGAIFMCTYARLMLPEEVPYPPVTTNDTLAHTIQPIVFFFVLSSVIVHGLTVPFFAFGKRAQVNLSRTFTTYTTNITSSDEPAWLTAVHRLGQNERPELPTAEQHSRDDLDDKINTAIQSMEQEAEQNRPHESKHEPSDLETGKQTQDTSRRYQSDEQYGDGGDDGDDPDGEWGGESTIEMKRYREFQKQQEQEWNLSHNNEERDVTDHPRHNNKYPKLAHWLQGHDLVLEYIRGPLEEPVVQVIKLTPDEHKMLYEEESPLRAWIDSHTHMMESLVGLESQDSEKHDFLGMWQDGIKRKLKFGKSHEDTPSADDDYDKRMQDAEIMFAGLKGRGLERRRASSSDQTEKSLMARVSRNLKPFTDTSTTRGRSRSREPSVVDPRRGSITNRLGSMVRFSTARRESVSPAVMTSSDVPHDFNLRNRQVPPTEASIDPHADEHY